MHRKCILIVVPMPISIRAFLVPHLRALAARYEVTVAANFEDDNCRDLEETGIRLESLPFRRKPSVEHDLLCLRRLVKLIGVAKPDCVHTFMPKGGVLGQTAALLCGVPRRIHTFTGQVWATRRGLPRWWLKALDLWISAAATDLFADSLSQRDFLIAQGIARGKKIRVPADGSISGVDMARFVPDFERRFAMRKSLGIDEDGHVVLCISRLTREKGALDLAVAFRELHACTRDTRLLVVGPEEETGIIARMKGLMGASAEFAVFEGYTPDLEPFLNAADLLAVPSHREGFGSVVLIAACYGVPAVASRIYGLTDAVLDGHTGLLHEPRNPGEAARLMAQLFRDNAFRKRLGAAARERAVTRFAQSRVVGAMLEEYARLLG